MNTELELLERAEGYFGVPMQFTERDMPEPTELQPDDIRIIAAAGLAIAQEMGISDTDALDITRTHLQMLHNLDTYIESREGGMSQSELHEHQHDVFHKIYDFFAHPPQDDDGEFMRHGYIKLPTGTGKTAIFTTLVDVLNKPIEEGGKKLKSLVLVPKIDLVGQTVGDEAADNVRGFARFATDTTTSEYHNKKKDLSGDAVVMTYSSFRNLVKAGKLPQDMFDIVICDELHNALGEQTTRALEEYGKDKFVLGLTATAEYAQDKKVMDLLPYEIDSMDLREAIEEGFLAPVRCFAITSDATIETVKGAGGDFSDKELEVLIENEWRNQKAVEFAKSFVEEGKQGLISCVPGQNLAHAKLMAAEVSKQQVVDAKTGKIRNIRALAVDGKMSKKERENIYQAYERGEYDVLTYVDLLTEGWDSAQAKFLINLRPTTSPVNAIQRLGRILRPNENGDIATVVEFIDKSNKPQFTFYHALGEDTIELGRVYGKVQDATAEHRPRSDIANLPADIRELLRDIDHRLIGELTVAKRESLVPNNFASIQAFSKQVNTSTRTVMALIEKYQLTPHSLHSGRNMANYLDPEQQALLLADSYFKVPPISEEDVSLYALIQEFRSSNPMLRKIFEELGVDITLKKVQGRPTPTVKKSGLEGLRAHPYFVNRARVEANTPLYKAADELGLSGEKVKKIAAEQGLVLDEILTGNGYTTTIISPQQLSIILEHPLFKIPLAAETDATINQLADSLDERYATLLKVAGQNGIKPIERRIQGGTVALVFSDEQQQRIKKLPYFELSFPDDNEVSLTTLIELLNTSKPTLEKVLEGLGIPTNKRRGPHGGTFVPKDRIDAIKAAEYFQIPHMAEDDYLLHRLGKDLGVTTRILKRMCDEGGIQISEKISQNGKPAEVVSQQDIDTIKAILEERLPSLPEGYMTASQFSKQTGIYLEKVLKLAERNGTMVKQYRSKAGRLTPSLSPEQQELIRSLA